MSVLSKGQRDTALPALLAREPDRAMEALVEKYSPLACHVAAKYLSDPEDVKECVNDAFTEVYLHRSDYSPERGSLAVWIGTITRNRAVSMYRKRSRDLPLPEDGAEADSHGGMAGLEESLDIERALSELSETDRRIIRMKYYEGMSTKEIAESLHLPYETVKKRHTRSIKSLRRLLLTLLIAAILLVLAACGVIRILRRFGVLPGYGVTTDPVGYSYVLEETAVYQEGPVTIEITKASLFNGKITLEFTVLLDKDGYNLPEYYEDGEPSFREMVFGEMLCDEAGEGYDFTTSSSVAMPCAPREGYREEFAQKKRIRVAIQPEDLAAIRQEGQAAMALKVVLRCDGVDYGEILAPFRLVRAEPAELEGFAYLYDEKTGGLMLENRLEGDTLTLDVFSISNGTTAYCPSLTKSLYYNHVYGVEAEPGYPPVTIAGEDGRMYAGTGGDTVSEYNCDSATFLFYGVTPGKYTLTLPYVYLLIYPENPERLVWNLLDCSVSDEKAAFPGGFFQTVSIRELDAFSDRTMAKAWEIAVRCQLDDPEMTAVEGAFADGFLFKRAYHLRMAYQYFVLGIRDGTDAGYACSMGLLSEESGNLIYTVLVNDEGLEAFDLTRVPCTPAGSYYPLCVRYDHPIELEFVVTE